MVRTLPPSRFRLLLSVLALAGLGGACEAGGGPSLGLETKLYAPAGAADPFVGVDFLALSAVGSDLAQGPVTVVPFLQEEAGAELGGIPYSSGGATRQVVVEGWAGTEDGQLAYLVSRGRSMPTSVTAGTQTQQLAVLFSRINSFVPLTSAESLGAQSLAHGRIGHTVTATAKGEVVIAGGGSLGTAPSGWWTPEALSQVHGSVEVVEERDNAVRFPLPGQELKLERAWHSATPIGSGQVFFAGGYGARFVEEPPGSGSFVKAPPSQAIDTVEVYDPGPDGSIKVLQATLAKARYGHTATLLDEGTFTILFVGGDTDGVGTYEVWNPTNGSPMGAQPLAEGVRRFHTATLVFVAGLAMPVVFLAGGESDDTIRDDVLVYDASTGILKKIAVLPKGARTMLTATQVKTDSYHYLYFAGGYTQLDRQVASPSIDVYNVDSDGFVAGNTPNLNSARGGHTSVLMTDEAVLIAGGTTHNGVPLDSIEVIHEYLQLETNWTCCERPTGEVFTATPANVCDAQGVPVDGGCEGEPGVPKQVAKPVIAVAISSADCVAPSCPTVPSMLSARVGHGAVFLQQGMALLVGGVGGGGSMTTHALGLSLYNPQ